MTYFTWLHNCRKDSQSKLKNPKARVKIWKILQLFVSISYLKEGKLWGHLPTYRKRQTKNMSENRIEARGRGFQ